MAMPLEAGKVVRLSEKKPAPQRVLGTSGREYENQVVPDKHLGMRDKLVVDRIPMISFFEEGE